MDGNAGILQLLLEEGADKKAADNSGKTPLIWAAMHGHEAVVQQLLQEGADKKVTDNSGKMALVWADAVSAGVGYQQCSSNASWSKPGD